jgi:hypothetical protein
MNPYSHLHIAAQLENDIRPTKPAEYYWGAVAPDVRYTAGVPRTQMHPSPRNILAFREKYPHLESFVQGYLVHCLTDLVDLKELFAQRILFRPVMKRVAGPFLPVLVETYSIERKRLKVEIDSQPNEMLRDLGIADAASEKFAGIIRDYTSAQTAEAAFELILSLNMEKRGANVEKYMDAARAFARNPIIKPLLFALANLEKLNRQALEQIRSQEEFRQICAKA